MDLRWTPAGGFRKASFNALEMASSHDLLVALKVVSHLTDTFRYSELGARGGTRTRTRVSETDFKSVASTSSATRALADVKYGG